MTRSVTTYDRNQADAALRRRFLWPALGVLAVAFIAATATFLWAGHRQDRMAADQSRTVATSLARQQLSDVGRLALDYSWWSIAVDKLVAHPDPVWADDNIGWNLKDLADISFSLVLSADDRLLYSAIEGERRSVAPFGDLSPTLRQGLSEVRAVDPRAPRAVTGFLRIGTDVFAVALGAVTPEKAGEPDVLEPPKDAPRAVLILGRRLGSELLTRLGAEFGLADFAIAAPDSGTLRHQEPLLSFDGSTAAQLTWRPSAPGADWIKFALPGLFLLIATIAGFALQVFRVWNEALDRLYAKELMLRAARDEAAASDQVKSAFLANVSHELRTPLNAIIGFSSIMSEQMLGPVGSAKYHGYAKDILGTARHLLAIINEILDLSSIESARHNLQLSNFPADDAAAEALRLARAEYPEVNFEAPDPTGIVLRADRAKIVQILTNLLTNAAKASGAGGRVVIQGGRGDAGGLSLKVIDCGHGIDDATARILFTPFARGANPYNSGAGGYGIGLAASKQLAELHAATLTLVTNTDARGSVAELRLPATRVISKPAAAISA